MIEYAVIPDDMSTTVNESSQDEGTHENSVQVDFSHNINENKELYYSAIYLKNMLLAVNTNIS